MILKIFFLSCFRFIDKKKGGRRGSDNAEDRKYNMGRRASLTTTKQGGFAIEIDAAAQRKKSTECRAQSATTTR